MKEWCPGCGQEFHRGIVQCLCGMKVRVTEREKELESLLEKVYQDLGSYPASGVSPSTYTEIMKVRDEIKARAE